MTPIRQSMWFLLTHSTVFLTVLVVFYVSVLAIIWLANMHELSAILLIMKLFVFLGIYLGGSLVKLKKNHLWKNNHKYKNSILHAFFIIIALTSISMLPVMNSMLTYSWLLLFMPFCVAVFFSFAVLGKNIIYKILIPATPIMLLELVRYQVDFDIIFSLIILATVLLVYLMYTNLFYTFKSVNQSAKKSESNTIGFTTTGLSASQLKKLNYILGKWASKWLKFSGKKIDWAILMPHTRLTVLTLFYTLPLLAMLLLMNHEVRKFTNIIAIMMLINIIFAMVMESRYLLRQTKFIAHVYSGDNHRQLKSKILFALDKNILVNCLVFMISIFLIIKSFSIPIETTALLVSSVATFLITLAIYPIFLCLNWVNISFLLVGLVSIYSYGIYLMIKWIYAHIELSLTLSYILVLISTAIFLRVLSQNIFWQRPIESLFNNK